MVLCANGWRVRRCLWPPNPLVLPPIAAVRAGVIFLSGHALYSCGFWQFHRLGSGRGRMQQRAKFIYRFDAQQVGGGIQVAHDSSAPSRHISRASAGV